MLFYLVFFSDRDDTTYTELHVCHNEEIATDLIRDRLGLDEDTVLCFEGHILTRWGNDTRINGITTAMMAVSDVDAARWMQIPNKLVEEHSDLRYVLYLGMPGLFLPNAAYFCDTDLECAKIYAEIVSNNKDRFEELWHGHKTVGAQIEVLPYHEWKRAKGEWENE